MCLIDKYVLFVYTCITHVFNRQVCFICIYVYKTHGLYVQIKHTCLLNKWIICTNKTDLSIKHMGYMYNQTYLSIKHMVYMYK
jgi:hypothetical protein